MKKVGSNVYGSGDTIVTKTSHFFQGLTLGAEGGGACTRYFTVHSLFNTCTNLLASQKGHHGVVLSLLGAGADVNIATSVSDVMLTS